MADKMEILKKLQALANDTRGNEEERKTAMKMLEKLMKKNGITEEDLGKVEMKERWFWYWNTWENQLLHQLAYMLWGNDRCWKVKCNARQKGMKGNLMMEMTDAEYIEFSYLYEVYKTNLWKEMDLFYSAFVQKNRLFPPDSLVHRDENDKRPDTMSKGDRIRMSMMMEGIEHVQVRKPLGDGHEQEE